MGTPGRQHHAVNLRMITAFREIGKGHEALNTFSACMNMPPPMSHSNYDAINDILHQGYKEVADLSMKNAAKEVRNLIKPEATDEEVLDTQVSIDGSWQKRGFSSMNGVVTAISSNGKVIDKHIMTKHCRGCSIWQGKKGTPEYQTWRAKH